MEWSLRWRRNDVIIYLEEWEFQGAVYAMDRFGIKESVLVTYDQSDLVNINGRIIRVVPAHEFLHGN